MVYENLKFLGVNPTKIQVSLKNWQSDNLSFKNNRN